MSNRTPLSGIVSTILVDFLYGRHRFEVAGIQYDVCDLWFHIRFAVFSSKIINLYALHYRLKLVYSVLVQYFNTTTNRPPKMEKSRGT